LSMLTGMVLFPFIIKKRDKKKKIEREQERQTKYVKYLENIQTEIYRAADVQKEVLKENYPLVLSQIKQNNFFDTQLWNRVIGQDNFLKLRIGIGNIPLCAEISFPEQRFSIDDDVMRDEVTGFSRKKQIISGAPVVYSLLEHRVSGIIGNGQSVNGVLNHLLLQIAALHSYDEVKLVFLCDEVNVEKYDYVRWMPHIWDDSFKRRFLATNQEEIRDLSVCMLKEMEKYEGEQSRKSPHYVVISTSKALSDTCVFVTELLKKNTQEGFSYVAVYDELKNLPKECTAVFQMNNSQGMMFDYNDNGGSQINFVQDIVTREDVQKAVMEIAEYKLDLQGGKYALPEMITFLDMFKVGKYEHLNATSRWQASNPVVSLQAPVGVNSDGGLFYLDLHEGAHGPHGLIAGMTGSGKSEFIITFILSLAVNYSPKDVAFILIDYKGGGLAGAFDSEQYHLPHLAGTITNLDGSAITRSLLSIQSELKRRQRVFAEARRRANEGTMDIYKYQKLYRNGIVTEPLPHLMIIAD
ncbi:MAG: type VII secretion protein EssC, partial [Lachnospiraceae bacterium]|nr:type VII secretion protein EssC [Lachnospiraceae bacterium]